MAAVRTKPAALVNDWASGRTPGTADLTKPSDAAIALGEVPGIPTRKAHNWLFNWIQQGVSYLLQRGIPEWDSVETYTKGSVVYVNSGATPPYAQYVCVAANPPVGTIPTAELYDPKTASGHWLKKGLNVTQYTASGTWTGPPSVSLVTIYACGGGGGGGGGGRASSGYGGGGGGGGGSAYVIYVVSVTPGSAETVTIGAGGSGGAGAGGAGTNGNNGSQGGDSSFAGVLVLGGRGGIGGSITASVWAQGGGPNRSDVSANGTNIPSEILPPGYGGYGGPFNAIYGFANNSRGQGNNSGSIVAAGAQGVAGCGAPSGAPGSVGGIGEVTPGGGGTSPTGAGTGGAGGCGTNSSTPSNGQSGTAGLVSVTFYV